MEEGGMVVYVVCAHAEFDSYHHVVLATLDKEEADKSVNDCNTKHDPDCRTQRPTWSDFDECFCVRRHMHELPLHGIEAAFRALENARSAALDNAAAAC